MEPVANDLTTRSSKKSVSLLEAHGYTLNKTIGHGTYAVVKIAHSDRLDKDVAVKIISKKRTEADYVEKFLPRELRVMKKLQHPNIIKTYEVFDTARSAYMVMELAPNGDVLAVVSKGPIEENKAREWFWQTINGVEYCHSRGIVHRDLKCENLLLDADFIIKITDFSFCKEGIVGNAMDVLSVTFCGTYAYACPEILHGHPYDPRLADVWSLGVVLYKMVFGKVPYDSTNVKVLATSVTKPPRFPASPVSQECRTFLLRILIHYKVRAQVSELKTDRWWSAISSETPTCSCTKKVTTVASKTPHQSDVSGQHHHRQDSLRPDVQSQQHPTPAVAQLVESADVQTQPRSRRTSEADRPTSAPHEDSSS